MISVLINPVNKYCFFSLKHLQFAKSNLQLIHLRIKSLCEEVILTGNNVNVFCVVLALFILFRSV